MNSTAPKLSVVLLLMGTTLIAPAALADRHYSLAFNPTELKSTEGMQRLYAKVRDVAQDYCPTYQQVRSQKEVAACRSDVVNDLTRKIDKPEFTDFVERGTKRTTPTLIAASQ